MPPKIKESELLIEEEFIDKASRRNSRKLRNEDSSSKNSQNGRRREGRQSRHGGH